MNHWLNKLIFTLICFFVLTTCIWAENEKKIAQAFVQHGIILYDKGDLQGALGDFSRALLLDSENSKAQDNLIRLSSHRDLNGSQKVNIFLLEDLLKTIRKLTEKIKYFQDKQLVLGNQLIHKGYDKHLLDQEMINIKDQVSDSNRILDYAINQPVTQLKNPLEVVNQSLSNEKDRLTQNLVYLQKQFSRLREINSKNLPLEPIVVAKVEILQPEPEPIKKVTRASRKSVLKPKIKQVKKREIKKAPRVAKERKKKKTKSVEVAWRREDVRDMKDELALIGEQLQSLQDQTSQKDMKIEKLTENLVDSTLELTEKEILLEKKVNDIIALNEELSDLRSRFELSQIIIKEKEERIYSVQENIDQQKANAARINDKQSSHLVSKGREVQELKDILKTYRLNLGEANEMVKERNTQIALLSDELDDVQSQLDLEERTVKVKESILQRKDRQVKALKVTIDRRRKKKVKRIEQLKGILLAKDEKLNELKGILFI